MPRGPPRRSGRARDLTAAVGALRALLRLPAAEPIELRGSLDLPAPAPLEQLRAASRSAARFRRAGAPKSARRTPRRSSVGHCAGPTSDSASATSAKNADTIVLGGLTHHAAGVSARARHRSPPAPRAPSRARARARDGACRPRSPTSRRRTPCISSTRRLPRAGAATRRRASQDNETLARRSYEAGEMNLMDFLLIRRDAVDTRTAIDRSAARRGSQPSDGRFRCGSVAMRTTCAA